MYLAPGSLETGNVSNSNINIGGEQGRGGVTRSRGATSPMEGMWSMSAKLRMRLRCSRNSMAAMPTYCDTEVASAAPATPQPRPKMNRMSIMKFATLDSTAEYSGVLQLSHPLSSQSRNCSNILPYLFV